MAEAVSRVIQLASGSPSEAIARVLADGPTRESIWQGRPEGNMILLAAINEVKMKPVAADIRDRFAGEEDLGVAVAMMSTGVEDFYVAGDGGRNEHLQTAEQLLSGTYSEIPEDMIGHLGKGAEVSELGPSVGERVAAISKWFYRDHGLDPKKGMPAIVVYDVEEAGDPVPLGLYPLDMGDLLPAGKE